MLSSQLSPEKRALSIALGAGFAFGPLGLQTPLVFVLSPLLGTSTPLVITMTWVINATPLTWFPIAGLGYWVGNMVTSKLGIDLRPYDPSFMEWINAKIAPAMAKYGFSKVSLLVYLLGSMLLAIALTLVAYPIAYYLVRRHAQWQEKKQHHSS